MFQDRFKSEAIDTDSYLLECVKYIHKNPVKAKIVQSEKDYLWSSYKSFIDVNQKTEVVANASMILGMFSDDKKKAIRQFVKFSTEDSDIIFMDLKEEVTEKENVLPIEEKIAKILAERKVDISSLKDMKDKKTRNIILKIIKEESRLSIRELSEVLHLSKDIIFRA